MQDNKKLTSTKHIQLEYKQGRCTLAIDKVVLEDEAEYKCEARNELGVATTVTELLVESKHKHRLQRIVQRCWQANMATAATIRSC